jgi:hypothetical protein
MRHHVSDLWREGIDLFRIDRVELSCDIENPRTIGGNESRIAGEKAYSIDCTVS